MNLKQFRSIAALTLATTSPLLGDIVFEFDYSKNAEFREGPLAAARQQALEHAASLLGSQFVDDATITIEVTSEDNPASDTLATAASNVVDPPDDFFGFFPSVVERKILEGVDDNGPAHDGGVTVNFGIPWDLDDQIASDEFDFKATIIHELLHALGFSSGIDADGADAYGVLPGEPGLWSLFDEFVTDQTGQRLIDDEFILDGNLWTNTATGGSSPADGLFFAGPQTLLSNNNTPVGLFSPNPWSDGSSGSHLDDDNPDLEGFLMLSATAEGPYTRQLSGIERAMLTDLGYTLKPVSTPTQPEIEDDPTSEIPEFELAIEIDVDTVYVTLEGSPGDYALLGTDDFSAWEPIAVLTIEDGQTEVTFEEDIDDIQFYRAIAE